MKIEKLLEIRCIRVRGRGSPWREASSPSQSIFLGTGDLDCGVGCSLIAVTMSVSLYNSPESVVTSPVTSYFPSHVAMSNTEERCVALRYRPRNSVLSFPS